MPKKVVPKFGVHETIQFVGLNELDADEQEVVQRLSTEHYEKIKRSVKNIVSMIVHLKTYGGEGKKKKYAVHVRLHVPTRAVFESCKSHDWELPRAMHKSFDDIRHQIAHKLRTDVTRPKTRD